MFPMRRGFANFAPVGVESPLRVVSLEAQKGKRLGGDADLAITHPFIWPQTRKPKPGRQGVRKSARNDSVERDNFGESAALTASCLKLRQRSS
jgi:hypothetical protein